MAIVVGQIQATTDLEAVYREDGARLWRALYAYSNDAELAFDAAAEWFAQALGRGTAIRDVRSWVWRTAFRVAAGDRLSRSHHPSPRRLLRRCQSAPAAHIEISATRLTRRHR